MTQEPDYAELYHAAPSGMVTTTPDGRIVSANRTFLNWTGKHKTDLADVRLPTLLEPGSQLFYENRLVPTALLRGQVLEAALTLKRSDQTPLHVLMNCVATPDADGVLTLHHVMMDASERRDYEQQLRRTRQEAEATRQRLSVLQDATTTLAACLTEHDLATALIGIARVAFRAPLVFARLRDELGEPTVAVGEQSLASFAAESARTGGGPRTVAAEHRTPAVDKLGVKAVTVIPLLYNDERVGLMVCGFQRAPEENPDFADLQSALGRIAAQAVWRLRLQTRLEALALLDPLTGLHNIASLRTIMDEAMAKLHTTGSACSLILIDLDDFKEINDTLGHVAGNQVLQTVAERLRGSVRAHDAIARYGGDEFVIICNGTTAQTAEQVAARALADLAEPMLIDGVRRTVTASVGVATAEPDSGATARDLFRSADAAMYRAKRNGKNTVTA